MTKLMIKQQRFADEYIISGNATQSAVKAGYSERYANTNASKLLQNTTIKSYIDDRLKELEDNAIVKQDEILKYLSSIMRGEQTEQILINVGDYEQVIGEIGVGAKDRIKAAELLGKRYGMWTEKVDLSGGLTVTIVDDIED